MAVEARHLNIFPPQLLKGNREIMNPYDGNMNIFNSQMGYSLPLPDSPFPAYNSIIAGDSVLPKSATGIKSTDSGLTCSNINLPMISRKRTRDNSINNIINPNFISFPTPQPNKNCGSFSFLGEDISLQIHQQQLDIDRLISLHTEKVRIEMEEKRKWQARGILEAIEMGMMKKLKAKEEEIEKIAKLNWALEEKIKSLCVDNQIWRDLAQTNEATANALRSNLEQVLAKVKEDQQNAAAGNGGGGGLEDIATPATVAAAPIDDAGSCCGSSSGGGSGDGEEVVESLNRISKGLDVMNRRNKRMCRSCGKEEACVLILPCRHLCLCTVCGSTLHTCPVCKSIKDASVHVNMS